MTFDFHPLAAQELADASQFYEGQASGLGSEFLNEIERLLELLTTYHDVGRPTRLSLRTIPRRRFPNSIDRPASRRALDRPLNQRLDKLVCAVVTAYLTDPVKQGRKIWPDEM